MRVEPAQHFVNWHRTRRPTPGAPWCSERPTASGSRSIWSPRWRCQSVRLLLEPHASAPFTYAADRSAPARPLSGGSCRRRRDSPNTWRPSACADAHGRPSWALIRGSRSTSAPYPARTRRAEPEETLLLGEGSCRDTAWLLVQLLRHLGLAARFVSGYLIQLTPDVKALDGPTGRRRLHRPARLVRGLPAGAGWIAFDPTSGLLAGEGHIPVAWFSPEPSSAAPVTGLVEESECEFSHEMKSSGSGRRPRHQPYTDEQWRDPGARPPRRRGPRPADVRRPRAASRPSCRWTTGRRRWNTGGARPDQRDARRRAARAAEGALRAEGLAHFGQGKWYPGEQLPRWSLNLYWRLDGTRVGRSGAVRRRGRRLRSGCTAQRGLS